MSSYCLLLCNIGLPITALSFMKLHELWVIGQFWASLALDRIIVHVTRYRLFVCLTQCSQWRTVWTYILALGYTHTVDHITSLKRLVYRCAPAGLVHTCSICGPFPLWHITVYCTRTHSSLFIYIRMYMVWLFMNAQKPLSHYVITTRTHFSSSCITALMRVWKMAQRTSLGFSCS